jgi:Putative adhesin
MNKRAGLFFTSVFAAAALAAPLPALAQRAAQTNDDWCRSENWGDRRQQTFCEVRDFTVPAAGVLAVDAEPNGGIDVQGTTRGDVVVRAKVSAMAETLERAQQIARSVTVNATASNVSATGPSGLARREQWQVSYRLTVPTVSSLSLRTTNGGIAIRDVDGEVEFRTVNGGVKLANMAGDVKGRTSNGGVDVDLDGPSWRGAGLSVETSNGGVHLRIPSQYSAQLETGTVNGGFNIDFPLTVQGRIDREINATLGSGGAPIRVRTHNGGVKVSQKE